MGALETIQRRKLSLDEYHRIGEAGILREDDRVELIDGEMIEKAAIGSRHLAKVNRLSRLLIAAVGARAIVSTQNPIALPTNNEPQPDVAVLKPREDDYEGQLPAASDVFLIVEVADTTLAYDRDVKIPLYARYGIIEAWLLDLQSGNLVVHRGPTSGQYQTVFVADKTGKLSLAGLPDVEIDSSGIWK